MAGAYATLGGAPVLDARVSLPRVGVWTAELRVDTEALPAGRQVLELGGVRLLGVVRTAARHQVNAYVRLCGGAGGLSRELPAKGYHSAPILVPLQDLADEAGERVAKTSDATVTQVLLGHWMRMAGPAAVALELLLLDVPGAVWRFLPNGDLWVGTESWPDTSALVEALDYSPLSDSLRLFSLSPSVFPGTRLSGRRVSYVQHVITEQRLETSVWFEAER